MRGNVTVCHIKCCAVNFVVQNNMQDTVALRIKLWPGLKLCKLLGQFLARVNKINYGVNYKFPQVTCTTKCRFQLTQSFTPTSPSTSSLATAALSVTLD
jgi:hypothetical protein